MAVKFINTDPMVYEQELIKAYEAITNRVLNPADPERLIINLLAYAITICAINIDETGRLNLLATSRGEYLDRLGELVGTRRLPAQKAKTILRFSITSPLQFDVVIPSGTRVGINAEKYFVTLKEAKIPAFHTSVDVEAEYMVEGQQGNGYMPGQVKYLIDVIPYITGVENITISMYGTDTESDDRYRERIRESLERFSTAGPREAYRYHVLSVHQDILDVSVWSPAPGDVKVTFIMKNGEIPDTSMINAVYNALNDEKVRPLTDRVSVEEPDVVSYQIAFTYYIDRDKQTIQSLIDTEVRKKTEEFILWTKSKLGRDILPERLTDMIMSVLGVHSIDITHPQKVSLNINQIAHCVSTLIVYGGVKE